MIIFAGAYHLHRYFRNDLESDIYSHDQALATQITISEPPLTMRTRKLGVEYIRKYHYDSLE